MQPFISIVGRSNTGKTTLLEKLITELGQRGYKVAVIKHTGEDFEIDKPNKDSWRFGQAGSEVVVISSSHKVAVIKQVERDLTPHELSCLIGWDYDLVLAEGFKQGDTPKIEVYRKGQDKDLLSPIKQLLAVVTDEPLDMNMPQFSRDEIQELTDLIEKHLRAQSEGSDIELFVNDASIPLNLFVRALMTRTLVAMVSGLKGVKEVKSLRISLRKKG
jgi:molybdopterin-guanine dinucleotide biosynthesis protein MobB